MIKWIAFNKNHLIRYKNKLFEFGSVNTPFFFEILAYYIDYIIIKNVLTD